MLIRVLRWKVTRSLKNHNFCRPNQAVLGGLIDCKRWQDKKYQGWGNKQENKEFLETQYAYTRQKPDMKHFKKRRFIAVSPCDVDRVDLVDMRKLSEFNDGFKNLLTGTRTIQEKQLKFKGSTEQSKNTCEPTWLIRTIKDTSVLFPMWWRATMTQNTRQMSLLRLMLGSKDERNTWKKWVTMRN